MTMNIKEKVCKECGQKFTLTEKQVKFYIDQGYAEPERCQECRRKKRRVEAVPCKECGKVFTMNGFELEFYEKNGLKMPKRCPECRKKRRENRVNNFDGGLQK